MEISLANKKGSTLYIFFFAFFFFPAPTNTHFSIYRLYVMSKQPAMFSQWKECTACPAAAALSSWNWRAFLSQAAQTTAFPRGRTSSGHLLCDLVKRGCWLQGKRRKDNTMPAFISGRVQNQICVSKVFYRLLTNITSQFISTSTPTVLYWTTSLAFVFFQLNFLMARYFLDGIKWKLVFAVESSKIAVLWSQNLANLKTIAHWQNRIGYADSNQISWWVNSWSTELGYNCMLPLEHIHLKIIH